VPEDPYTDPVTGVLRNKLGLRTAEELQSAEREITIMSGRYTREHLVELAAEADRGFDRLLFADALGALTQITDTAFAEYRADPGMVADMRAPVRPMRRELLAADLK